MLLCLIQLGLGSSKPNATEILTIFFSGETNKRLGSCIPAQKMSQTETQHLDSQIMVGFQ